MHKTPTFRTSHLLLWTTLLLGCFLSHSYALLWSPNWDDIPEEELRMREPKIDPGADVEYLERSMIYDDTSDKGTAIRSSTRCMVFTQKGVEEFSQVDIYYEEDVVIYHFAARITYPDGSVEEMDDDSLYDRDILKGEDIDLSVKSFSVPRLVPGTIIEYKYTAKRREFVSGFPLYPETEWPTHRYYLEVRPYQRLSSGFSCYNGVANLDKTQDGYFRLVLENMPGSKSEPYSNPKASYEPWVYLQYSNNTEYRVDKFWENRSKNLAKQNNDYIKGKNRAVRKKAEELFSGLTDDEAKLRKAYDFCTREITNLYAVSKYTTGEIAELDENEDPGDTLEHGYGYPFDIDMLFASLLSAADIDVRLALVENKEKLRYSPNYRNYMNLTDVVVVAQIGDQWLTFNPGSPYLPYGILNTRNAAGVAMVGDRKEPVFINTGILGSEDSLIQREAQFNLDAEGNLDGQITITYTGYPAISRKRKYDSLTPKSKEETFLESIKEDHPAIEISDFKMEGESSRDVPLKVSFAVKMPRYAEQLGSRLFFSPSFFEAGKSPLFEAETRKTNIIFSFPYVRKDIILFNLPEGYQPEELTSPGKPIQKGVIDFSSQIGMSKDRSKLRLVRQYDLRAIEFDEKAYPQIKAIFEEINRQDGHTVSLKQVTQEIAAE